MNQRPEFFERSDEKNDYQDPRWFSWIDFTFWKTFKQYAMQFEWEIVLYVEAKRKKGRSIKQQIDQLILTNSMNIFCQQRTLLSSFFFFIYRNFILVRIGLTCVCVFDICTEMKNNWYFTFNKVVLIQIDFFCKQTDVHSGMNNNLLDERKFLNETSSKLILKHILIFQKLNSPKFKKTYCHHRVVHWNRCPHHDRDANDDGSMRDCDVNDVNDCYCLRLQHLNHVDFAVMVIVHHFHLDLGPNVAPH